MFNDTRVDLNTAPFDLKNLWQDIARQFRQVTIIDTQTPRLARRQGAYAVVSAQGMILKRGHELAQVLKVFDRRRFEVVE